MLFGQHIVAQIKEANMTDFDLASGFIALAGILLGLAFMAIGLSGKRAIKVVCVLHPSSAKSSS